MLVDITGCSPDEATRRVREMLTRAPLVGTSTRFGAIAWKHASEVGSNNRTRKKNRHLEAAAAFSGTDWRATVDEDGHYSFAVAL
jgi:hypothetical protein